MNLQYPPPTPKNIERNCNEICICMCDNFEVVS